MVPPFHWTVTFLFVLYGTQTGMSHSDILTTWKSNNNLDLLLWIGKLRYIEMKFKQFSRNNTYVSMSGKFSGIHLNVSLFSNQGEKVLNSIKARGQIFTELFTRIRTFSPAFGNNNTLKCILDMLTYMLFLEYCWNYISKYFCSLILGRRS